MAAPSGPSLTTYLRAVLPSVPGVSMVPGLGRRGGNLDVQPPVHLPPVRVDRGHLRRFNEVCGFVTGDELPAVYPHVLTFAAQLGIMASPGFPFPAMGLVHVANDISVRRPLRVDEELDLWVRADNLRPHPAGQAVDLVSEVISDDEIVWRDVSTYLRRGKDAEPTAERPGVWFVDPPTGPVTWRLPAGLGRDYAAVSGDRNPIHLSGLTARGFGYPKAIAHGMWTASRAFAMVAPRLPGSYRYTVSFGAPILLPATVGFGARGRELPVELAITSTRPDGGRRVHMCGAVSQSEL